jgi:hypothetical protein
MAWLPERDVCDINHLHLAFDALMDATTSAEVEGILGHLSDEVPPTE